MELGRKSVSYWESLHRKMIGDKIHIEEINLDIYCRYLHPDDVDGRQITFGPDLDEKYTCMDLINTIWQGMRNSCIDICSECQDLLRLDLKDTPVMELTEVLGWSNIQQVIDELIRFVTTDMLFSFMTKRLGISFSEVGDGTVICGYNADQIMSSYGWSIIPVFCRISGSSFLSNDIISTMCLLRLLYIVQPFITIGDTYESAFSNITGEFLIEYTIQTFAAITLQRAWRRRNEQRQLFALGLVIHRKTNIIQGNLMLCYQHIVSPTTLDFFMSHRIFFDE